jgi:hypothetical protein
MAAALLDHHAKAGSMSARPAAPPATRSTRPWPPPWTSSYSTTADTYTHVMPAHSAEAVPTVAALFERPSRLLLPPTAGASEEA